MNLASLALKSSVTLMNARLRVAVRRRAIRREAF